MSFGMASFFNFYAIIFASFSSSRFLSFLRSLFGPCQTDKEAHRIIGPYNLPTSEILNFTKKGRILNVLVVYSRNFFMNWQSS